LRLKISDERSCGFSPSSAWLTCEVYLKAPGAVLLRTRSDSAPSYFVSAFPNWSRRTWSCLRESAWNESVRTWSSWTVFDVCWGGKT